MYGTYYYKRGKFGMKSVIRHFKTKDQALAYKRRQKKRGIKVMGPYKE